LEVLFGQCREYLLYIANRELSDAMRAKVGASDLVQDSLLKAHRSFEEFRGATEGEFLTWLRQILIRACVDARRRYQINGGRDLEREASTRDANNVADSIPTPSVQLIALESADTIAKAMEQLPDACRRVVIERIWEGKSFVAIAEEMGRSPDAIRKLWFRGVDQLRQIWQRMNEQNHFNRDER
jgi:RNA polymerase sigma-70 factor (ECF subfamily)